MRTAPAPIQNVFAKRFSLFLAPSLLAMGVSFVMVPVTTYVLGPEAFGVFGLMNAAVALGWTIAVIGSSAVCNAHFIRIDRAERARLVSTMLAVSLALSVLFVLSFLASWPRLAAKIGGYAEVSAAGVALSMATVVLGVPWIVAQDVITLDGKARGFAVILSTQTLTMAAVTVTALYVWRVGVMALFIAAACGAAVTAVGAVVLMRPYLTAGISSRWAREILSIGPANAVATLSEALQANVERSFIAASLGLGPLGLLLHAQNYRIVVAQFLKAAARPVWPITLLEAEEASHSFSQTRTVWDAMYLTVTAAGVTFAFFGREIIGWLTHGRFADAHSLVTLLMVFLLVQNAGKPQTGLLYRARALKPLYWCQAAASVVWFLMLMILVPLTSVVGSVLALIAQQIVLRGCVQVLARRCGRTPMSDGWVLAGGGIVAGAWAIAAVLADAPQVRALIWLMAMAALMAAGRRPLRQFLAAYFSRRSTLPQVPADSVSAG